jgi:acyl-CoA thioesterase II
MTADADPDAGTGRAGEHARGGLSELLGLLDLEGIDTDLFRSRAAGVPGHRLFGGQVAAQALVAAERTAGGARAHSLWAWAASSTATGP